jgi:hypothetical protein
MANLSGHAAGNGGYRQGDPTVSFDSLLLGRRHHSKPGPRHRPTRLWAGSERVGERTGGGDRLVKQEVVARRSGESFKL